MKIIAKSGEAKGNALSAISLAREGQIEKATEMLEFAEKNIEIAGELHMDIIVQEAQGVQHDFKVLFMHSEDQFLTTQTFILLAREFIKVYEMLKK